MAETSSTLHRTTLAPAPGGVTAPQGDYPPPYHSLTSPPPPAPADPARAAADDEDDEDTMAEPVAAGATSSDGRRLADVAREAALAAERTVVADTLRQVHWNRRKAAQLLGVSYKTLLNKIKETGIERP